MLSCAALLLVCACVSAYGVESLSPWPGRTLAPFSLESLDGRAVSLADARGAPVLVHYFATWCLPCRRELPALAALSARLPASQLNVIAISVAEPDIRVRRFFEALPVPFPVVLDRQRALARQWGIDVLPTTILLDASLEPRFVAEGEVDWGSDAAAAAIRSLAMPTDSHTAQTPVQKDTP